MTLERVFGRIRQDFSGRIREALIDDALSYVGFNECRLALEVFLDHLEEHDVSIDQDEFVYLGDLAFYLGVESEYFLTLQKLLDL